MTQFDDRYDPIYQRGHGIPAEGRPQDLSAGPAGRTARYASTPGEAGSAGADVGFAAAPAAPSTSSDLTGAAGISEVVPPELAGREEGHDAAPPTWSKFNPFLLALWLLGTGATALGVWAAVGPMAFMNDPFGASSGFGSPEWMYLLGVLSPGLVAGGLMALATALALHSLAWQRRKG
jgi:hypothetical protein